MNSLDNFCFFLYILQKKYTKILNNFFSSSAGNKLNHTDQKGKAIGIFYYKDDRMLKGDFCQNRYLFF